MDSSVTFCPVLVNVFFAVTSGTVTVINSRLCELRIDYLIEDG